MIYTSDTRPESVSITAASQPDGVDVFIHEMILPPELLAMKNLGLTAPDYHDPEFLAGVVLSKTIIQSSHTPQGAFGYLLSQIRPHPRLSVISHFPVADDTVACALNSVRQHCPWVVWNPTHPNTSNLICSTDLMVLRISKHRIEQFRGVVPDYAYGPPLNMPAHLKTSKYHATGGQMDPTAQLDLSTLIPPVNPDGSVNYCESGY